MTDRADTVITAIDHAIEDWETSPDAMRWSPDIQPDQGRSHPADRVPPFRRAFLDEVDITEYVSRITVPADGLYEVRGIDMGAATSAVARALRGVGDALSEIIRPDSFSSLARVLDALRRSTPPPPWCRRHHAAPPPLQPGMIKGGRRRRRVR